MSLETCIHKHLGLEIVSRHNIGTGLFEAYQLSLSDGRSVFAKYQTQANNELINEGRELALLGQFVATPKVLASDQQVLILEWIETAHNPNIQQQLGKQLATLHQQHQAYFGFEFDNKIGQTPQHNAPGLNITDWVEFYWQYRLKLQIELAEKNGYLRQNDIELLLKVENELDRLLAFEIQPSLLHGDLWSGNFLSGKHQPYLIDTASYYGHREADLALTFIFGGFSREFYQSYQQHYPLEAGFEARKPLYMLYHYLNHLNLFGSGYHASTLNCARQLISA